VTISDSRDGDIFKEPGSQFVINGGGAKKPSGRPSGRAFTAR
jgi:hypothetical protein